MAMDLHGILNQNEYYTNHYFTTIFEENASDTISAWRQDAKDKESVTPWAAFRDTSKNYYRIREKYLQLRNEDGSRELIENQAAEYVAALGYGEPDGINIELNDEITVPVFHEVKKPNGAPLLWVLLSVVEERNDDILMGNVFGRKDADDEEYSMIISENNDDVLAKLFFAGAEAPRWIILIGINQIALIDRNKWDKKKYLQFDLEEIFSRHEETTFQALAVLLHKESLCPAEGNSLLDALDENSYKHSSSVSDSLKYALRECIELLGNEVLYDMRTRQQIDFSEHPIDAGELTIECLRYMYRVLFMLFIEAREELGFAPMKSDVYQKGYSLEGVRDVCENVRELSAEAENGYYIDETISALFDMIYTGYPEEPKDYKEALKIQSPHDMFTIEPLKAHIFDPQYTKLINEAKLRNVTMLKIVDLMSISRPSSARERRGRISYSALGINQMGAVYEALLSYRGFIAEEDLYEVKRAGDKFNELDVGYFVPEKELDKYTEEERVRYEDVERRGKLRMYEKGTFIYRLAGREREKSASYYTPEVLTKCLVKYALKELLKNKKADEILNLTVCEPAMGSAAFLNEAISQLAEAYLDKKQEELGEQIAFDKRTAELQRVKMFIADRNVYGVDLNPIAVELAEVSLWLNTIYKGAHVPWFGTQLACGNSLIGARRQVYNALKLKKGTWYNEEPEKVPEDWVTDRFGTHKVYKRKRSGASYIYHFLLGDPGMANYTDKVIKDLEADNIKLIKKWQKEFCAKYSDDDIEILNKLSEIVDDLWIRTIKMLQKVEVKTADSLCVYGHNEGEYEEHLTIREKDAIYKKIYKSEKGENASPYARLKAAMDYWCALWFWPIDKANMLPSRQQFFMELSLILEGGIAATEKKRIATGQMEIIADENGNIIGSVTQGSKLANEVMSQIADLGNVNLEQIRDLYPRLQIADDIAKQQRFMHWELEFADLFYERGGFDLVIGNPPWIKLEWDELGMLSDYNPFFKVKKLTAPQVIATRSDILKTDLVRKSYQSEYISTSGQQNFLNAITNYKLLKGQQTNLYKCFLPLSWEIGKESSVYSFIHPDGIFDDPKGGLFREEVYSRLRKHFMFANEKKLFAEIDHHTTYSLNVYGQKKEVEFDSISNLYAVETIDGCYMGDHQAEIPLIKDDNGSWNTKGHPHRIIHVTKEVLEVFAKVFDGGVDYKYAKLPVLHANSFIDVLTCIANVPNRLIDVKDEFFTTEMWHETNAQKDGTMRRNVHFPKSDYDVIYSGPHFWLSNPLFKTSRRVCELNSDYDMIDLTNIDEDYKPRYNYEPLCSKEEYINRMPTTEWGKKNAQNYRIIMRNMLGQGGERTLVAAIAPPNTGHVHAVYEIGFKKYEDTVYFAGLMSSLPYDFYIKTTGKSSGGISLVGALPYPESSFRDRIEYLSLRLNCLNDSYRDLWKYCWHDSFSSFSWMKNDPRLEYNIKLSRDWQKESALRTDYERRMALIEIDVMVAMSLGMTLEQLISIYKVQFYIMKSYEGDTWYDANGRIVFSNKNMGNLTYKRQEWQSISSLDEGNVIKRVIEDDTKPGGPVERTIEYVAPFDRCDREKDYEEVWANFEKRFKGRCRK